MNSKESQSSRIQSRFSRAWLIQSSGKSFRLLLDKNYEHERKSNAGRKTSDPLILFKMLDLQQLFNLSDEELEFHVNDRRFFEEFVVLDVMNSIPDSTAVAFFRERLRNAGVIEVLFEMFEGYFRSQGLQARGGQIIDATLVPVPKQRNTHEENKEIKAGRLSEGWYENPVRLQQKDLDARWTIKNGISCYGYKNSICIDVDHGFICRYAVTTVNIHDSQMLPRLQVTPRVQKRQFLFVLGKAVASDQPEKLSVQRRCDVSLISFGVNFDQYEIIDALVVVG